MVLFDWVIFFLGVLVGIFIDSVWTGIMLKRFAIALDMLMEMNTEDEK